MAADGAVAIERLTLLQELSRLAAKAGVDIRYEERLALPDLYADLVIAADGGNRRARQELRDEVGARVDDRGRGLYLWAGAGFALDRATFELATTEHGTFTLHAYPYARTRARSS